MHDQANYRRPKNVIEWKRTTGQFVAILEPIDQFDPKSIRELKKKGHETLLVGRLKSTGEEEWYALAYSRVDLEFDEARTLARATLERWRDGQVS